jgi:hypothetical protein
MLLIKPYIINIDVTKRYRDSLILFNNKSNRLLIVTVLVQELFATRLTDR